jgi:hypothetical protein
LGVEGIVSKRRDAPYRGTRSASWLKVKCVQRQEFVIGGFTDPDPRGSRQGIGSMLLGHYEGPQLRFAGKVGTGKAVPEAGFTKLDLANVYAQTAEWALPHIAGRPLTLVRCEHGASATDALRSECRFLPHAEGWHRWVPATVRRARIPIPRWKSARSSSSEPGALAGSNSPRATTKVSPCPEASSSSTMRQSHALAAARPTSGAATGRRPRYDPTKASRPTPASHAFNTPIPVHAAVS